MTGFICIDIFTNKNDADSIARTYEDMRPPRLNIKVQEFKKGVVVHNCSIDISQCIKKLDVRTEGYIVLSEIP